ncbi:hypothetical protein [Erwinia amylovora]|uniref:hypothetical protein n=1 Tax=Erwinia amylovora TaxID=552 RepID=UPI0003A8D7D5|nr:hypothetical protein [Erwinia amylovora]
MLPARVASQNINTTSCTLQSKADGKARVLKKISTVEMAKTGEITGKKAAKELLREAIGNLKPVESSAEPCSVIFNFSGSKKAESSSPGPSKGEQNQLEKSPVSRQQAIGGVEKPEHDKDVTDRFPTSRRDLVGEMFKSVPLVKAAIKFLNNSAL